MISLPLWLYLGLLVLACLAGLSAMNIYHRRSRRHTARRGWHEDEDGVMLIWVALSLVTSLLMLNYAVILPGVLFVARGQAQNAADAGALAGAVSLVAIDTAADPALQEDEAIAAARGLAAEHPIWNQIPTVEATITTALDGCTTAGGKPACVAVTVGAAFRVSLATVAAHASATGQARETGVRLIR